MGLVGGRRFSIRPWLVLVFGLALTGTAALALPGQIPNNYQATARLMLLLPADAGLGISNPFLDQPGGLVVLGNVVAEIPNSSSSLAELAALGLESEFEIGLEPSEPVIRISVQGEDADDVIRTRDWIVSKLQTELRRVQKEVEAPASQTAAARTFVAEPVPYRIVGDPTKALLGVVTAGGVASMLVAGMAVRGTPSPRRGLPDPEIPS